MTSPRTATARTLRFLSVTASLVGLFAPVIIGRAAVDIVQTDAGRLAAGPARDGVTAFLGIPYAAPPVGDLRWRPPQPAVKWNSVRKADRFGTSCRTSLALGCRGRKSS